MALVRRSALSEEDYRAIWNYIAADSPDAADRLLRSFDAKLELYAENPRMGTLRDALALGLRSFPVGKYLLFYRIIPEGIELVRVLHGQRDIQSVLKAKNDPPQNPP